MVFTIRVSLPGYDALTDGTIDHYSLYADSDNMLIKEERRGTVAVDFNTIGTISHNIGYIPFYLVYTQISPTRYRISNDFDFFGNDWRTYTGTANLVIQNFYGTAGTVAKYYIFYDNVGAAL